MQHLVASIEALLDVVLHIFNSVGLLVDV